MLYLLTFTLTCISLSLSLYHGSTRAVSCIYALLPLPSSILPFIQVWFSKLSAGTHHGHRRGRYTSLVLVELQVNPTLAYLLVWCPP
jgi:hypothetical protein